MFILRYEAKQVLHIIILYLSTLKENKTVSICESIALTIDCISNNIKLKANRKCIISFFSLLKKFVFQNK
jgi:hypothetical protein